MLSIVGGRQQGKTSALIKLAHEHGGYIVVRSKTMAAEVANRAREVKMPIAFPLTYEEFLNKRYFGKGISKFWIDDADALLQSLTEVPIEGITITGGNK